MRGVHVFVDRPIPYHGPPRRPFDFGVQAMFAVEPHGLGHDNRRGTSNGNKPDTEIRFSGLPTGSAANAAIGKEEETR